MTDLATRLSTIRRPRLLIRAARFGLTDYRRERDLKRALRTSRLPSPMESVARLIETEAELEHSRQSGDAAYDVTRHVEVLISLMAESSLLPQRQRSA